MVPQTLSDAYDAIFDFLDQEPGFDRETYGYDKTTPGPHNGQALKLMAADYQANCFRPRQRAFELLYDFYDLPYNPWLLASACKSRRLFFNDDGRLEYTENQYRPVEYAWAVLGALEAYIGENNVGDQN